MAVIPMWKCDRDGSMFSDKKAAEEHDKMLELAANITMLLEQTFEKIDEQMAEDIGLLFAKHKETLAKAIKGKPELVLEIGKETTESQTDTDSSDSE